MEADVTLNAVRSLKPHRDWEEDHKDIKPPKINAKDWPRTIETVKEWLRGCLGVAKIPLLYVVRDNIDVLDAAIDPPTNYTSLQDELIAHAPIRDAEGNYTATYLTNCTCVWEKCG